jgi:hypothetical protein
MTQIDIDRLLFIVVGAHLSAEVSERPLAYRLVDGINQWLGQHETDAPNGKLQPLVCTDIWYLNNSELHSRPAVSIGGPGVNALAAYLHQKLPTVMSVNDRVLVQMDVDLVDTRASAWGIDAAHTVAAVEQFQQRYLDAYLDAVVKG